MLCNLRVNLLELNCDLFMSYRYYKGSNSKSDLQTHSRTLAIMPFDRPYMISYLSSIVTMSSSCTVSKILSLIVSGLLLPCFYLALFFLDTTTFEMNMTASGLENSFIFDNDI